MWTELTEIKEIFVHNFCDCGLYRCTEVNCVWKETELWIWENQARYPSGGNGITNKVRHRELVNMCTVLDPWQITTAKPLRDEIMFLILKYTCHELLNCIRKTWRKLKNTLEIKCDFDKKYRWVTDSNYVKNYR